MSRPDDELKVYADLVRLYPENEAYLKRYAELLHDTDQIATAIDAWRALHALLIRQGKTKQADELARAHPEIGRIAAAHERDETIAQLLPESFRGRIWRMMHGKRLKEGEALCRAGEAGDSAWWLVDGELAVMLNAPDRRPVVMNLIQPGDIVGEQALLEPGPRTATIVANRPSTVVELPRKPMLKAMVESPDLQAALQRKADFRQMTMLVSRNPLLRGAPMDMRQFIARETTIHTHPAGATIHRAGEIVHHVSMLVRGRAAWVWNADGKPVTLDELTIGELAGDTSAVREASIPADLLALTDATIARIPLACFKTVVEGYPPLREALLRHAENERERLMRRISRLGSGTTPPNRT